MPSTVSAAPGLKAWLDRRSDAGLVGVAGSVLFVLSAWPLLLVAMPPLQDLPNHLATAHIIAHPALYPEYGFNGFFKSNSLLTLWLVAWADHGLIAAARAFAALVLAANAFALPAFVLRFAGRRGLATGMLLAWPLVHAFFFAMGMLNFAFAFALSLVLLVLLDGQRERPTWRRGLVTALLAGVLWYAHPFPLMMVVALVGLHALGQSTWRNRARTALTLLSPLAPLALLALGSAQQHLVKAEHARDAIQRWFAYLPPWETLAHLWLDASGALTRWGSVTVVPALLLVFYGWRQRRLPCPFFSPLAMACLGLSYLAMPSMLSNWCYFNSRVVPFLWAGAIVRLPQRLPKAMVATLLGCALWFSATLGIDYLRLERDRAHFAAGIAVVPERATLLPLLFEHRRSSDFTASLTHAWADYVLAKNTSAPLVFAVERSYPITYRVFPPPALIPPALDELAEKRGNPDRVCRTEHGEAPAPDGQACMSEWLRQWASFWKQAEPRFSHVLTWAMPDSARQMLPATYRRVFAADELQIYARVDGEAR